MSYLFLGGVASSSSSSVGGSYFFVEDFRRAERVSFLEGEVVGASSSSYSSFRFLVGDFLRDETLYLLGLLDVLLDFLRVIELILGVSGTMSSASSVSKSRPLVIFICSLKMSLRVCFLFIKGGERVVENEGESRYFKREETLVYFESIY